MPKNGTYAHDFSRASVGMTNESDIYGGDYEPD